MNLRDDVYENMLSEYNGEQMWRPKVGFLNAITGSVKQDDFSAMMIRKDADDESQDFSMDKENLIFSGSRNPIMLINQYQITFRIVSLNLL